MTCTALPRKQPQQQCTNQHPVAEWDVYVDDFLGVCQGNLRRRKAVKRHLLHALDKVLCKLEPTDNPK